MTEKKQVKKGMSMSATIRQIVWDHPEIEVDAIAKRLKRAGMNPARATVKTQRRKALAGFCHLTAEDPKKGAA